MGWGAVMQVAPKPRPSCPMSLVTGAAGMGSLNAFGDLHGTLLLIVIEWIDFIY